MAGGRSPSVVNRSNLLERIRSCRRKYPTIDAIVDHLQSTYRDYRGLKKLPFTSIVQQSLDSLNDSQPKTSKRQSVGSEDEAADFGRKKRRKGVDDSSSCSSSPSSSSCGDGAVSEDAVHGRGGKAAEAEIDVMKSMLRSSYTESKKWKPEKLEAVTEKNEEGKKIDGGDRCRWRRFRDLGGMKEVVKELKNKVLVRFCHPEVARYLGDEHGVGGILLHGPPGCGKTTLARAIAIETGVPFYEICATELVSGVSGTSEQNIRELFAKAHKTAPSIIFIDEIDSISSKRDTLQRETDRRIVAQLMTCMDGFHKLEKDTLDVRPSSVLVIGATNFPDAIDPALRRPGRFDVEILLDVPDEKGRVEILSVFTKNLRLEGSFDISKIARATPGFVGADLGALTKEAVNLAIERVSDQRERELSTNFVDEELIEDLWKRPWSPKHLEKLAITMADFEEKIKTAQPSLKREGFSAIPNVKWEDIGGLEGLRMEFDRHIVGPIKYPEDYEGIGINLETGILLYGPPGCGKTLIAQAVANEAGANFIYVKGPELINKYVGESERAIRTLFRRARTCSPCIIFIDEVDAVATNRDDNEGGQVVGRLLNQLLIELDGVEQRRGVFIIGATNRLEAIDRAVLRPGRFSDVFFVPVPGPTERGLVLKALARNRPIDASIDLHAVGEMEACENFSGADLAKMLKEATMGALEEKRTSVGSNSKNSAALFTIKMSHIERALAKISPSVPKKLQRRYYQTFLKWKRGSC